MASVYRPCGLCNVPVQFEFEDEHVKECKGLERLASLISVAREKNDWETCFWTNIRGAVKLRDIVPGSSVSAGCQLRVQTRVKTGK